MKKIYLVAFLLSIATPASAIDNMICDGEIGNGYTEGKSGYRSYGKKTVRFSLDCGWYKRYIQSQKNCTSYLEGQEISGYLAENLWTFFSRLPDTQIQSDINGRYNTDTHYLFFQIKKGRMQTGNVNSQNETQRWFNGYCY